MRSIIDQFTREQVQEMFAFLERNKHVVDNDGCGLLFEMLDRFDYLDEDTAQEVIDYWIEVVHKRE